MSPEQLLDTIEQRAMVGPKVIATLRQQLAGSTKTVSARRIVKLLVDRGHLTAHQAQLLLETEDSEVDKAEPQVPPASGGPEVGGATGQDEELGIAPGFEDELGPKAKPQTTKPIPAEPYVFELDDGDDDDVLQTVEVDPDEAEDLPPQKERQTATTPPPAPASSPPVAASVDPIDPLPADQDLSDGSTVRLATRRRKWWRNFVAQHGKTFRSKQWDSPLMLVGGGSLVLLLLVGAFLFLYLWRGSGDEQFQQADEDYLRGAYNQSILQYERFFSRYPRHPKASLARVRRGLARISEPVEVSKDWDLALERAREVLPQIKEEEAFDDERAELSSLLPDIYAGFVQQAQQSESVEDAQRYVDVADQARQLVDNSEYLPTSLREPLQARIDVIEADRQLVIRNINRDTQLQAAVEQIASATAQGDVALAYQTRRELLMRYPRLGAEKSLQQAVLAISQKEQELVRKIDPGISALAEDHSLPTLRRVVLADRKRPGQVEDLADQMVYFLLRGAVYGLKAATGQPQWRRYVGYQTTIHPTAMPSDAGADAVVVDSRRFELLRVAANTGQLVWRLPLEEGFAPPLVLSDRIMVATTTGKLLRIDPATGQPSGGVQLPQSLAVAPGVDPRRGLLYQVGSHSTLFALSADTLDCTHTFHLGHQPGSVAVAPVVTMGHVFVVENRGLDYSRLHVLAAGEEGLSRRGRPIRLTGQVVTPLVLSERRVLLATDRGAVRVYEVDPGGGQNSVREIARVEGTARRPVSRHLLADRDRVWAADERLVMYELNVPRGELSQKWVKDEGDAVVAPLLRRGNTLFHARRPRGASGLAVAGTRVAVDRSGASQDGQRVWETEMAVPLAGDVMYDAADQRVSAVSSHGAVYDIDGSVLRRGITDRPAARVPTGAQALSFRNSALLGRGRYAFSSVSDARRMLMYEPPGGDWRIRLENVSIPKEDQALPPVAMAGSLLVPTRAGPVYHVEVDVAGQSKTSIYPFQPRLAPGQTIDWRRPAVVDQQKQQFVIADTTGQLFLVGLKTEPQPQLAALGQRDLDAEVVSPLATVGPTGYVVVRKEGRHLLASFQLADLKPGPQWPLQGHVVWGPERVADVVLVATDAEGLICLSADSKQRWAAVLDHGPLAGRPMSVDESFVMASVDGTLWRIDASSGQTIDWDPAAGDGKESGRFEVGEPLGAGPVAFGRQLLLVGRDGTLYVTPLPKRAKSSPAVGQESKGGR